MINPGMTLFVFRNLLPKKTSNRQLTAKMTFELPTIHMINLQRHISFTERDLTGLLVLLHAESNGCSAHGGSYQRSHGTRLEETNEATDQGQGSVGSTE